MMNIVASSAMYRPTIIESEEMAKKTKNDEVEIVEESAVAIDFSIFCDPGYLLFFISQGIFFAG